MRTTDHENMIHFLNRPSMYISTVNKDKIVSFMHGADFGKQNKPYWTKKLKEFISTKFNINGGALGWPNQVEIYSQKKNLNWTEAFKKLMLQMIEESN